MDDAADEAKDDARANLLYNSLPTLSTNSSPALFRLLLVSFSTLTARVSGRRRRRIVFDINDGIIAQLEQFKPLFRSLTFLSLGSLLFNAQTSDICAAWKKTADTQAGKWNFQTQDEVS